jgi:hypothetical protein
VGVIGANVNAAVPAELLEANPNVGLHVLHQMPNVDVPIGIRQGGGHKDFSRVHREAKTPFTARGLIRFAFLFDLESDRQCATGFANATNGNVQIRLHWQSQWHTPFHH